jgi:hypothetical protein
VLPRTKEEVTGIVKLSRDKQIPYVARGNGGSTAGLVFTNGIVIDLNRMKEIRIDKENWVAQVEAGVTSYDLQKEVAKEGLRINTAEPAATVCGNIICSGIFSTWANAYGLAADNAADAEFVGNDGNIFRLNDKDAPNMFAYKHDSVPSRGICTKASVRMHPVTKDEEGVLVPFATFEEAVTFSRELSMRRIGLAIAVLGDHYISAFISPTQELAEKVRPALTELLGIKYMVFVVGDRYAIDAIRKMERPVIDNKLFRTLVLGLPRLIDHKWQAFVRDLDWKDNAFEILAKEEMRPLIEAVLSPSADNLSSVIEDKDLREFYKRLYERPEMTDLVWLNMFRIVSCRMARHKHMCALILFLPLDNQQLINDVIRKFEDVAVKYDVSHDYGFLTPMDLGKRAILEYDYYVDQADESDKQRVQKAMMEIVPMIEELTRNGKAAWIKHVVSQGLARKEQFMYA